MKTDGRLSSSRLVVPRCRLRDQQVSRGTFVVIFEVICVWEKHEQ